MNQISALQLDTKIGNNKNINPSHNRDVSWIDKFGESILNSQIYLRTEFQLCNDGVLRSVEHSEIQPL